MKYDKQASKGQIDVNRQSSESSGGFWVKWRIGTQNGIMKKRAKALEKHYRRMEK